MKGNQHQYGLTVTWTGNKGQGTSSYTAYERDHIIQAANKIAVPGSSDPMFRGDATRYNPEEMLVASLSSCHMLWYLHLCAEAGVVVTNYTDHATGTMTETAGGGGHFSEVTLHPVVTVSAENMISKAYALHEKAHAICYIANSCNFPIRHEPVCHIVEKA